MMKILIVSDTHRNNMGFEEAYSNEGPVDMLIHCGDIEGSEYYYSNMANENVYMVAGNNDYFSGRETEEEFKIGKYKVFLTHGHYYGVNMGLENLIEEAKERRANIVMFGHIHRPVIEYVDGIWVINPGSLSYPRQQGKRRTYIVMTMDEHDRIDFELKELSPRI